MTSKRSTPSPSVEHDLLDYLDASPTPYHAVAETAARLEAAGYTALSERDVWSLAPGGRHFVVRNGSSIAAFRVGSRAPAESGFRMVGAHTDSPNLRLKPRPGFAEQGVLCLGVEIYGSPILATWTDRDLGLAGRVVVEGAGGPTTRLVRLERPVLRIPNLAIHLNRGVNEDGLRLDKHRHLAPVVGGWDGGGEPNREALAAVAHAAGADLDALRGFDLCLFDLAPARFAGLAEEFVVSARLDNLGMCHAALTGLLHAKAGEATAVALLFDHEEVGSESAEGASGAFARDLLARIVEARPAAGGLERAVASSVLVSADMAHAVHPSHAERSDAGHGPRLNGGPVVKTNANRRYATDGETGAFFRRLCAESRVPCQDFVSRGDMPCGSTIGPLVASGLGVRTVDVGSPMLSMHSIREMAGRRDPALMATVLARLFSSIDPLPS